MACSHSFLVAAVSQLMFESLVLACDLFFEVQKVLELVSMVLLMAVMKQVVQKGVSSPPLKRSFKPECAIVFLFCERFLA